jgi:hypothetical protein
VCHDKDSLKWRADVPSMHLAYISLATVHRGSPANEALDMTLNLTVCLEKALLICDAEAKLEQRPCFGVSASV